MRAPNGPMAAWFGGEMEMLHRWESGGGIGEGML